MTALGPSLGILVILAVDGRLVNEDQSLEGLSSRVKKSDFVALRMSSFTSDTPVKQPCPGLPRPLTPSRRHLAVREAGTLGSSVAGPGLPDDGGPAERGTFRQRRVGVDTPMGGPARGWEGAGLIQTPCLCTVEPPPEAFLRRGS